MHHMVSPSGSSASEFLKTVCRPAESQHVSWKPNLTQVSYMAVTFCPRREYSIPSLRMSEEEFLYDPAKVNRHIQIFAETWHFTFKHKGSNYLRRMMIFAVLTACSSRGSKNAANAQSLYFLCYISGTQKLAWFESKTSGQKDNDKW